MIIPVKDRPDDLERALTSLLAQTEPPHEIIVVDQSADDRCKKAVDRVSERGGQPPFVRYVHDVGLSGLTAARNLGAQLAKGDLIAYCDDDAQLDPDGLAGLNQAFAAEPKLMAAGGVIKNYDPPSALAQLFTRLFYRGPFFDERQPIYWNWRHLDPDKLLPTSKLNGGMMAFRRDILDRVGGFDDRLRAACVAEDIDIAQRILLHCGEPNAVKLVPSVRIVHESLGSWRKEDRSIEFQIVSQHYLLHRNLGYAATHHFQYWWMVFGLLLRAAIASIRRRRLQPLRSFAKGIKCIQHDYRNCPFIGPASTASR